MTAKKKTVYRGKIKRPSAAGAKTLKKRQKQHKQRKQMDDYNQQFDYKPSPGVKQRFHSAKKKTTRKRKKA